VKDLDKVDKHIWTAHWRCAVCMRPVGRKKVLLCLACIRRIEKYRQGGRTLLGLSEEERKICQ
jgi:hypothetical protein